ncbi:MAG: glycosyl hydrolase, partial [Bacteroidales bacterium]|nr:glycosyl hydrolase [Bacteroidales bacterium]
MKSSILKGLSLLVLAGMLVSCTDSQEPEAGIDVLASNFITPPDNARPGVYWYFMDGNFSKEGITKDLEAMRDQGIGYVVFLEVNVGVPRGPIDFMSDEWLDMFGYIVSECRRTGVKMVLGIGPGWTGSGGPWVKGEDSMQHLVASTAEVEGGGTVNVKLEVPAANPPYFGEGSFTPKIKQDWLDYYQDVCVLAFPTPEKGRMIDRIKEKALYIRHPFSSMAGVLPNFEAPAGQPAKEAAADAVDVNKVMDISSSMDSEGNLQWNAPEGKWTVMRFGSRNNGAATRPAPTPGVGMEADKFSGEALRKHLANFTDKLFEVAGEDASEVIELLHLDSWEMGAQNWNQDFRNQFKRRRGYDPLPWFPAYTGLIVGDPTLTERFLWDVRKTAQELVIENHVGEVKRYAREHGQKV